jgi:Leucine-rich repeat (LRR) protein
MNDVSDEVVMRMIGSIPFEIGQLRELRILRLNDNNLKGNSSFRHLDFCGDDDDNSLLNSKLHFPYLLGTIPLELGMLSNLSKLSLADNKLTGETCMRAS